MAFKVGQRITWTGSLDTPAGLRDGTVTKVKGDLLWVDNQHRPEDCIYAAFCWPFEVRDELVEVLQKRADLKKAYDNSMALVYQLANDVKRRGLI